MSSAKKKSAKKRTTKAKKRESSPNAVTIEKKELLISEKEFINVYDKDPVLQTKSRLSWLIVGIIMIIIISFWFWSLKISMRNNNNNDSSDLNKITSEIDSIVGEFRAMMGKTKNVIDQTNSQAEQETEIDRIKNDVLNQIQANLDSANWPQHSSNLLELTLKYPTNWFKKEEKNLITLASYDLKSTTTSKILANIAITKISDNKKGIKIEDLINEYDDYKNYQKSSEEIFIDLLPVERYDQINTAVNNIMSILFIRNNANIYQITIYSQNGKNIFEATINKILSTIDLL